MKHRMMAMTASLVFLTTVLPAYAHTGVGMHQGYLNGLLHPLTGIDHLLVILGVGIWGTVLGGKMRWLLPVAFLFMMTVGAGAGFQQFSVRAVEIEIAFSVLAIGLILASERQVPAWLAAVLAGFFAFGHGYVHAVELESGKEAIPYVGGFLTSTVLLLGLGSASLVLPSSAIWKLRNAYALVCTLVGIAVLKGI